MRILRSIALTVALAIGLPALFASGAASANEWRSVRHDRRELAVDRHIRNVEWRHGEYFAAAREQRFINRDRRDLWRDGRAARFTRWARGYGYRHGW